MLIKFSIGTESLAALEEEKLVEVLSELLRAHRKGYHLVVIPRPAAQFIMENLNLTDRDKALLSRLSSEFTQTGTLCDRAKIYIELYDGNVIEMIDNAVYIPISSSNMEWLGSPCGLLTEDIQSDAFIVNFVLHNLRDIFKTPAYRFTSKHGGGSRIYPTFQAEIAARNLTLCVLDTDRKTPISAMSLTTKRVVEAANSDWPLAEAIPVPCHEIENLIPFSVVLLLQCSTGCSWNTKLTDIDDWEIKNSIPNEERFGYISMLKMECRAPDLNSLANPRRIGCPPESMSPTLERLRGFIPVMVPKLSRFWKTAIEHKPNFDRHSDLLAGLACSLR